MTTHSFLTALSPIDHHRNDPGGKMAKLKETLAAHEQDNSPFSDCPMVHMARLQILDQLIPPMGDTSGAHIKSKYLLFAVDLDGQVDDFLDCLYRVPVIPIIAGRSFSAAISRAACSMTRSGMPVSPTACRKRSPQSRASRCWAPGSPRMKA